MNVSVERKVIKNKARTSRASQRPRKWIKEPAKCLDIAGIAIIDFKSSSKKEEKKD